MARVSICLPNLNTARYLPELFAAILAQTFEDWECVVSDNFSDDESWEIIRDFAGRDSRIVPLQAARHPEGMYPNWNNCIERALGEYVYIATSDDTLAADFLEKMVHELDSHPECDLAHCPLRIIDGEGRDMGDWWQTSSTFAMASPGLLGRRHIRHAPFDGLLHIGGQSVYISITQLLIRRRLFDQVGLFSGKWRSLGDFHWNMRASLVANTVHVPDTWGGWRVHPQQATAQYDDQSAEHLRQKREMIEHAMGRTETELPEFVRSGGWQRMREYLNAKDNLSRGIEACGGKSARIMYLLREYSKGSQAAWDYARWYLGCGPDWFENPEITIRRWAERHLGVKLLIPLDE